MTLDPYTLPPNLPIPEDDGAADHLPGLRVPTLLLESSRGAIDLAELCATRAVLYVYPRTGQPGVPSLPGWDDVPGARGCTPQSCAFRDHAAELAELDARIAGMSSQPLVDQIEFAERNHIGYPVLSDPDLLVRDALGLPTFEIAGHTLYKRLALIVEAGVIEKIFYPVFPPDRNASDVVAWLRADRLRATVS
jgi:peroxiredoxin